MTKKYYSAVVEPSTLVHCQTPFEFIFLKKILKLPGFVFPSNLP